MKRLKKRKILICAAVLLALAMSTQAALAYFSDYDHASGSAAIHLTPDTVIDEPEPTGAEKIVAVENIGEADVYVRVAIYGPDKMTLEFENSADWYHEDGDVFYYYKDVLSSEDKTSTIKASIQEADKTVENLDMDIIVVHESTPLVYDNEGKLILPEGWIYPASN